MGKAKNRYGQYWIPQAEMNKMCGKTIRRGMVWEPETVRFMRAVGKGKVIVHAGAHFGDMIPSLARAAKTLIACEPDETNFQAAKKTVQLSKLTNVQLHQVALHSDDQGVNFLSFKNSAMNRAAEGEPNMPSATIDQICQGVSDIGVIHLDVEGWEEHAIRGGIKTIKRCRPIILVESVPIGVMETLNRNKYKPLFILERNTVFIP